jgi:hypothetical protein
MKLKCKQDVWPATNGLLGIGAKPARAISGLTKWKEYEATPIAVVSNWTNHTSIDADDYCFLIYNDLGQWETYPLYLFEPADGN